MSTQEGSSSTDKMQGSAVEEISLHQTLPLKGDADAKTSGDEETKSSQQESRGKSQTFEAKPKEKRGKSVVVKPDSFEPERHFYPRTLNAMIHPMVASFFSMGNERIIARYCHLHPYVEPDALRQVLKYRPAHFRWAGCDTFNVTDMEGKRQVVVIETNSCPSGQKSMPVLRDVDEEGGYRRLIESTFAELLKEAKTDGVLAVVYDKNLMEASGYASVLADLAKEQVYLVEYYVSDSSPPVRWTEDKIMQIRTPEGEWKNVRAAFRYVTQRPWTRFPVSAKTLVLNPILPCLAGGRNKMVASKAYNFYNADLQAKHTGLSIRLPETVHDVRKVEVPLWVKSFGGHAVVKVPYSNAGQGVYTILSQKELDEFMAEDHHYEKFIVQSLIGNAEWSSKTSSQDSTFYHVGTVPNKRGQIFVADVRMMVSATSEGFQPLAVYARRARDPLKAKLSSGEFSWGMLGTNLSVKLDDLTWDTEAQRLLLMDRKDFNTLGLGLDDLIEAYVQTVLATIAIDRMCKRLTNEDGSFNLELFRSLNDDPALLDEIML